ncbi:60S ribosomal protein L6 [Anopheles marshallii]|uniref:60S ribosomal protein L6 n=1 Tax=Anopheles marshallii TaxID=1521116 RepID=UPI00237A9FBA|nr:60S ribosomal protein L6 [Anopheles marshallii]
MAPTETKAAAPAKVGKKVRKDRKKEQKVNKYPASLLTSGMYRIVRRKMIKKRPQPVAGGEKKIKKPVFVVKKIGGAKNGGERKVLLRKNKADLPTRRFARKRPAKSYFRNHKRNIRRSLKPGTVLILLAGRHKGKRVVLLKVMQTGLLLVTGPFEVNACPMRRIEQNYVIATKTRVNLEKLKLPEHINDRYFRRILPKKDTRVERDIFSRKEFKYVPTEQRKADQKVVDAVVKAAIKEHPEGKLVMRYLKSMFSLRSNMFPHRMQF